MLGVRTREKIERVIGVEMSSEIQKTVELMKKHKEEPTKETFEALVQQVRKTTFLIPANFPTDVDVAALRQQAMEHEGERMKMPEGVSPLPAILQTPEGDAYLPLYTDNDQIPKEPKFDLVLNVPFKDVVAIALNPKSTVSGVVLNAFSENLMFQRKLLEAIKADDDREKGAKQIRVSPEQFMIMMRQKVEFHDLPYRAYHEKASFMEELSDKREAMVNAIFATAFQQPQYYPYREADFEVMALDINEELSLIRIDLPEIGKLAAQLCFRVYITMNPKTEQIHYFTIERAKEKGKRNLCGIDDNGQHIEYGEAPVEGAEIQRIMDIINESAAHSEA